MPSIPLIQFRQDILSAYQVARKRPRTISGLRSVLAELQEVLGPDAQTADLTTAAITSWMAQKCPSRGPNTVIGLLGRIRAATSYAAEEGFLDRAPNFKRLRPKRKKPRKVRHLTFEQIQGLLEHLRAEAIRLGNYRAWRLYGLAAVMIYTGLRRDAALFLPVESVDVESRVIWITPHHLRDLKTEAWEAPVPMPPELVAILGLYMPWVEGPWMFRGLRRGNAWHGGSHGYRPIDELRTAVKNACGVEGALFTWLRVSLGTHMATRFRRTREEVQAVLRHTSTETSKRFYLEQDLANLRAIGDGISFS